MSQFEKHARDQVICIECGETIMYKDDPTAVKLYPIRCDACIAELVRSGTAAREGYTPEELRWVL